MNRKLRLVMIVVGILLVTSGVGFALAKTSAPKVSSTPPDHTVSLLNDHADPSAIAVTKGDYVQFNAKDGKTHNIGQGSGNDEVHQGLNGTSHEHDYRAKESGAFGADEGYRVQFNQTGTFSFHDHLNPKISVTVIVYEKRI